MTSHQLQSFLNQLNSGKESPNIFKHQISKDIYYGQVWEDDNPKQTYGFDIFFIKDSNSCYIGAVMRHYNDLHWYITKEHRGKGYLTKALKNTILPYIFDELCKEEQCITIDRNIIGDENYKKSSAVAFNCGFERIDDKNYKLVASAVTKSYDDSNRVYKGLGNTTITNLKNEFDTLATRLNQIEAQITNGYEKNIQEYDDVDLSKTASKLRFLKCVIDDMQEDFISSIK